MLRKTPKPAYARKALQLVLVARRPLTVDELDVALSITKDIKNSKDLELLGSSRLKETLPSLCGLTISIIQSKVYFIHQTVKEFLVGDMVASSTAWQKSFSLEQSEVIIRDICLYSIKLSKASPDLANFFASLLPEEKRVSNPGRYCHAFAFLSYSAIYWADHCRDSKDSLVIETITRLVDASDEARVGSRHFQFFKPIGWVTPLHAASAGGHLIIVKHLLELGLDVNAEAGEYDTALWAGLLHNNLEIVMLLLENGADLDHQNNNLKRTVLHKASSYGYEHIVRLCLDAGANPNIQDEEGQTALFKALRHGYGNTAKRLFDNRVGVNFQDKLGESVPYVAQRKGGKEIVQLLLNNGADVNLQDKRGESVLYVALEKGEKEIAQLLLDNGADVNLQDDRGGSALHKVVKPISYIEHVEAELFPESAEGNRWEALSPRQKTECLVELLLENGANVNLQDRNGHDALFYAAKRGHKRVVRLLLERGAGNNTSSGRKALRCARENGDIGIVNLLLGSGITFESEGPSHGRRRKFKDKLPKGRTTKSRTQQGPQCVLS